MNADVLIVGNGALGLFLAKELKSKHPNKSVVIVGPKEREGGASQAAGAMLGCFGEVTTETLRTEEGRKRFNLGVEAHNLWNSELEQLKPYSDDKMKVADDTFIVLNTIGGELDSDNYSAISNALTEYQKPFEEVDPKSIPALNPRPDCRSLQALKIIDEGAVNGRTVLRALESFVKDNGVEINDDVVTKIIVENDITTGVKLRSGNIIQSDIVVVAAGARTEELVSAASENVKMLPTFPGLGLGILAKRSSGQGFTDVVRTPNRGFACGLHIVPQGNGYEYIGSTNRIVHEVMNQVWLEDARYLTKYAMQQLDEKIADHHVDIFLRGNRPITLDGFPIIGEVQIAGLYVMTGTYRDGFHSAPLLAQMVTADLFDEDTKIDPLFSPDRQPIDTRTIEHSIEEYAHHSVATWYETGADSCVMPTNKLYEYYGNKARSVYDKLGIDFPLGPDVLWYAVGDDIGANHIKNYFSRN